MTPIQREYLKRCCIRKRKKVLYAIIKLDLLKPGRVKSKVGTDWTAIVTHELGHAVDDYLTNCLKLGGEIRGKARYISSVLRPKVMSKCNLSVQRSDIKNSVSEYAAENAKEFGKQFEETMKGVK